MTNRPTPETDAFITSQDYSPTGHQWRNFTRKMERKRDEAREENEKLREALLRVRTWGIESKNFSSNDNGKMAHWIDEGCTGELPEPDGPWIYERMEAAK